MKNGVHYREQCYYVSSAMDLLQALSVDGFRIRLDAQPDGTAECGLCRVTTGAMYLSGPQPTPWQAIQAAVRAVNAAMEGL